MGGQTKVGKRKLTQELSEKEKGGGDKEWKSKKEGGTKGRKRERTHCGDGA